MPPIYLISQTVSAFTFYSSNILYGLKMENVLSVNDDLDKIQNLPINNGDILGVYNYQDTMVPVFNYASLIGVESGQQFMQSLIEHFEAREKDHVEWINDLEKSIVEEIPFTKALDPHKCAFGQWHDNFQTRDETLKEILAQFSEPHRRIHSLAETLLALRDKGKQDEALEHLNIEKYTTLRRLRSLFNQAREQVKTAMRPVILFLTKDGIVPTFGIVVDEIMDVIEYNVCDIQSDIGFTQHINGEKNLFSGMYMKKGGPDSIIVNIDKIVTSH